MKQKSFAHLGRKLCAAFMACAMVLSSFSVSAQAEETSTTSMPTVKSYEKTSGSFVTAEQSRIYYVSDAAPEGDIADTLKLAASESAAQGINSGNVMDIVYGPQENVKSGDIVVQLGDVAQDGADAQQAYEMDITEDNIVITAEVCDECLCAEHGNHGMRYDSGLSGCQGAQHLSGLRTAVL